MGRTKTPVVTPAGRRGKHTGRNRGHKAGRYLGSRGRHGVRAGAAGLHGGPLWEPLCYAQIGGLAIATVITLLLVPVFYSISVLDLKIVKWEPGKH